MRGEVDKQKIMAGMGRKIKVLKWGGRGKKGFSPFPLKGGGLKSHPR
jgi:hypothetical protein